MKKYLVGSLLALVTVNTWAMPYTFTSGGTISAAQINANFAYLESLATAQPSPTTYQRYTNNFTTNGVANPVFTATQNSIIRDIFISSSSNTCILTIGTNALPFSISNNLTNIAVPVLAGEAVSISCTSYGALSAQSMMVVSQ